jgi:hypothetical protein
MDINSVKQNIISDEAATDEAVRSVLHAIADSIIARTASNIRITEQKFWMFDTIGELADAYNIAFFVNGEPRIEFVFNQEDANRLNTVSTLATELAQSQAYFEEIANQNTRYGISWNRAGKKYMLLYSDDERAFNH